MKRFDEPILVTRPYLPPLEEFESGCAEVWKNRWLTNNGPMLEKFHAALADYLGVDRHNLALFNNGTLSLLSWAIRRWASRAATSSRRRSRSSRRATH